MNKCDAVFEGGGVRGIGLVGAVAAVEEAGYTFENLAGTSAGAIVAALLAAGYRASEMSEILSTLDYREFEDETFISNLGWPGKLISEFLSYGAYKGEFFEKWLQGLLKAKGKTAFGDIRYGNEVEEKYRYKFQAIAADLSDRRLLVLPGDLKDFGYKPDEFSIAAAVRMSMSIPLFFTPVKLSDRNGQVHYIVDGGVLSNYPIWLLDDGSSDPPWPTFGFKLVDSHTEFLPNMGPHPINSVFDYLPSLIGTLLDGHDNYHISTSRGDFDRTIRIPTTIDLEGRTKKIGTIDFDLSSKESKLLFDNGWQAGQAFLQTWNFSDWKKKYRQKQEQTWPKLKINFEK